MEKKIKTRDLLIQTAGKLFTLHGVKGVSAKQIAEAAGTENEFIFGARFEELEAIRDSYDPKLIYENDEHVRRALDSLTDIGFKDEDGALKELKTSLLEGASWHKPDHYFVLKDFISYREARLKAYRLLGNEPERFKMMSLKNTLASGIFSSDRTITEYNNLIWHLDPMTGKKDLKK